MERREKDRCLECPHKQLVKKFMLMTEQERHLVYMICKDQPGIHRAYEEVIRITKRN